MPVVHFAAGKNTLKLYSLLPLTFTTLANVTQGFRKPASWSSSWSGTRFLQAKPCRRFGDQSTGRMAVWRRWRRWRTSFCPPCPPSQRVRALGAGVAPHSASSPHAADRRDALRLPVGATGGGGGGGGAAYRFSHENKMLLTAYGWFPPHRGPPQSGSRRWRRGLSCLPPWRPGSPRPPPGVPGPWGAAAAKARPARAGKPAGCGRLSREFGEGLGVRGWGSWGLKRCRGANSA